MRSRVLAYTCAVACGLLFPRPGRLHAQSLSFGVKAGVPFTDAVEGSFGNHSEARHYTLGPMVEVGLPFSLAAEFNALYRRTGYSTFDAFLSEMFSSQVRANSWEFPVLLKYYLGARGSVRPYLEAGYVVRHLSGAKGVARSFGREIVTGAAFDRSFPLNPRFLVRDNPTHGPAVGGGLRFRAGRLRLAPGIRYTRWIGHAFDEQGSRGFFVRSLQNQTEFLIGVSF